MTVVCARCGVRSAVVRIAGGSGDAGPGGKEGSSPGCAPLAELIRPTIRGNRPGGIRKGAPHLITNGRAWPAPRPRCVLSNSSSSPQDHQRTRARARARVGASPQPEPGQGTATIIPFFSHSHISRRADMDLVATRTLTGQTPTHPARGACACALRMATGAHNPDFRYRFRAPQRRCCWFAACTWEKQARANEPRRRTTSGARPPMRA